MKVLKGSCLVLACAFAGAVSSAFGAAIVAKGKGDNGNGTQFTAKDKYITSASGAKNLFKIKNGLSKTEYEFCFSTDGCDFKAAVMTGVAGRAKLKYDEKKGGLPGNFARPVIGDQLLVNGTAIGTFVPE